MVESLRDSRLMPFVGLDANLFGRVSEPEKWRRESGFLPGSAELARYLSREFRYPLLQDWPDLARVAQYSLAAERLEDLYNAVSEIFDAGDFLPTPLHSIIAEMAARAVAESRLEKSNFLLTRDSLLRRFVVVTTGYDNLFEKAFAAAVGDFHVVSYAARGDQRGKFFHLRYAGGAPAPGGPPLIGKPNNYGALADGNPVILKLPGTVESADPRYAITEDDYFDFLTSRELPSLLPSVVAGKLKGSNHLFLGYSPFSWNMRVPLYRIWGNQRSFRKSWAVLSETETLDETFWKACGVTVVRSDLKEFVAGLRAAVEAAAALVAAAGQ